MRFLGFVISDLSTITMSAQVPTYHSCDVTCVYIQWYLEWLPRVDVYTIDRSALRCVALRHFLKFNATQNAKQISHDWMSNAKKPLLDVKLKHLQFSCSWILFLRCILRCIAFLICITYLIIGCCSLWSFHDSHNVGNLSQYQCLYPAWSFDFR